MTERRRVVIVGGGITGLAAAWELSGAGGRGNHDGANSAGTGNVDVTVLEAGPRLGGRIATSGIELPDGSSLTIDEGADAFLSRVPDAVQLCDELGLSAELTQPAARSAMVFVDGQLRPLPEGTVLGVPVDLERVAEAGVLSEAGLARAAHELDRVGPAPDGDVAIGPFLRERYGDEAVDRLVAPLIGGINAGDVETMSLTAVTPQLAAAAADGGSLSRALARRQGAVDPTTPVFRAPLGGMGQLIGSLTAALSERGVELRTGRVVRDISVDADTVAVTHGGPSTRHDDETAAVDAVIVATPARVAAPLLGSVSPDAAELVGSIRHSSVALATIVIASDDIDVPAGTSGFLVPRASGLLLTAASFGSNKWEHWDDGRHVVLRVSAGRDGDERAAALSDDELATALLDDLRTTVGLSGEPLAVRVSRYPDGFAQYGVGHLDLVEQARAALAEDTPRVLIAGSGYDGVGIPASIRSGRTAARSALR